MVVSPLSNRRSTDYTHSSVRPSSRHTCSLDAFRISFFCFLLILVSGCADLEAPIREVPSDQWSEYGITEPDLDWDLTPPDAIEVLIVGRSSGKGILGHTAIHIGRYAYSWDYGGGYVLVRRSFRSFLRDHVTMQNERVKGIMIEYPEEAIERLKRNLDQEFTKAWSEGYKRSSMFFLRNCSTIAFKEMIKASGRKPKPWPPVLIPVWMGKNVQRTFPLLHYTIYEKESESP